jgi:hypothetical protein
MANVPLNSHLFANKDDHNIDVKGIKMHVLKYLLCAAIILGMHAYLH